MATVPVYGQPRVPTRALPGVRVEAQETATTLGGPQAQVQGQIGAQLTEIGLQTFQVAAKERAAAQAHADDVANLTTLRRLNELDQRVLRDPDTGYLNTRGLAAIARRDEAFEQWDTGADAIGAPLRSPRQQFFFEQQRVQRRDQLADQANKHLVTEQRRHDNVETAKFLETSTNRITVNAGQPHIVAGTLAEQTVAITDYAARNGLGTYETAELRERTVNAGWSAAITQSLAAKNPKLASGYFTWATANGQLTGTAKTQMQTAVAAGVAEQQGETGATEVWREIGPKDLDDPVKLFDMHERARAMFRDDPDARQAAIDGLTRRKAAWDAQINAEEAATTSTLGKMVLELVPVGALPAQIRGAYEQIRRTPAYITAPTKLQADVRTTLENEAIRSENRLYTAEQREYTAEQRRISTLTRQQLELEINGWGEAWRLQSDPRAFSQLTYDQIVGKAKTLGVAHVNRLLAAQQDLRKPADVSTATIDMDQFKAIAFAGGVTYIHDTPANQTPEQRANAGRLLHTVQQEIGRQEAGGRKLSYEQKGTLMKQVLDQKVTVDHGWWYGKHEVSTALVANPADQQAARVPLAAIDPRHLADSINLLRSLRPWLQRTSDEEIKATYARALERAYGAYVLGLGDEVIQQRLLEPAP